MNKLIVASSVLRCKEVDSTNEQLRSLLRESVLPEGYTITSTYQRLGRGQPGTSWEAAVGQNLLVSVFLKPRFLTPEQAFFLNMSVCLAVHDCLTSYGLAVSPKWPNDLWDPKGGKFAGILIENQVHGARIESSIVGLGLNVNQAQFEAPHACSMAQALGKELPLSEVEARYYQCLDHRYRSLHASGQWAALKEEYLAKLYAYQYAVPAEDKTRRGHFRITGVADNGRLHGCWEDGKQAAYAFKEIRFLRPT
ncbi:MAG: biotin--[acetyl-CoA-carboxylase] ligase [Schleiferiaceae bacterium]|nr:biotin--[acetyl-CoA-carboxylase] ligase [Schleiferiaceae bacterium]